MFVVIVTLINMLCSFYLLAVLLRFLLQAAQADYYNPISQAVVQLTEPMLQVFRRFIPSHPRIDFPTLALAFAVEIAAVSGLGYLYSYYTPDILTEGGVVITPANVIMWSLVGTLSSLLSLCFWIVVCSIIISFVLLFSGGAIDHPAMRLVWQTSEPLLAPFRRLLPPMGGLDFSPILMFLAIIFAQGLLELIATTNVYHKLLIVGSGSLGINFRLLISNLV